MPVMDPKPTDRLRYVFDEGELLEIIPREINRTWSDICEGYRLYGVWTLYPWGSTPLPPPIVFLPTPAPFFSFFLWYPRPKFRFFAPAHFSSEDSQPPLTPGPPYSLSSPKATVISDGYTWLDLPQNGVHAKWNKPQTCPLVNFIPNMKCVLSKDTLLSERASKQSLIDNWPITGAGLQQM